MRAQSIELLAPARTADIAIEAIKHGADAVYIGATSHGARSAAANSVSDIARVVEYAHIFGVRVYVTLNTLVYEKELSHVERLIQELYKVGVDALIVQDMGVLRMDLPPIDLHASTQTDIRTVEKARFLTDAGFSQLVLPREMTVEEMSNIHREIPDVVLEAFVHGALCVSYSGDCQAGFVTQGRSANRGECPQVCRHSYDLIDGTGSKLIRDRYLLSLRDLNRSRFLADMLAAGISSFKIEGRMKDVAYVKNTVTAYRKLLDEIIDANGDKFKRSSSGVSKINFTPSLEECFNRGYTSFFTSGATPSESLSSYLSPKWVGRKVGRVIWSDPDNNVISIDSFMPPREYVVAGDGLGYFDADGKHCGFRVNIGATPSIYSASKVDIPKGTILYRNSNYKLNKILASDTAKRYIPVDMTLRKVSAGVVLDVKDNDGHSVSVLCEGEFQEAKTDQNESQLAALRKTGGTVFEVGNLSDMVCNLFIPRSILTKLRRQSLEMLSQSILATYKYQYRKEENKTAVWSGKSSLTFNDNAANSLSVKFYEDHGLQVKASALECSDGVNTAKRNDDKIRVMTCRYCIRREFGKCSKTCEGKQWKGPLYLQSNADKFLLEFDCKQCRMHVYYCGKANS